MDKQLAKHQGGTRSLIASSGFPANKYTVARNTGEVLRNTPVNEIRAMIDVCALLAGFSKDVEDRDLDVLVSQLVQNKGYFKNAEIKAAFDCAFNGELNISHQDLKPYNSFSWLYVSRILNAYEKKVQEGKLIQDLSEPLKKEGATKEELIESKKYVVDQIIEQFTRDKDFEFGPIGNTDFNIVNMVFDTLKLFGYALGEPDELRQLYHEERNKELRRAEYWRKKKERGSFSEYKDPKFMNRHKEAMNRNKVHREVAKRCRMISVNKFYDEQKEFENDLVGDIKDKFNHWVDC